MSGSPPLPPRRNPDASDRGHGGYGSMGQDVFRGNQTSQAEHPERSRGPPLRGTYQEQQLLPTPYASYRLEDMPSQVQYQQPPRQQMQLPPHPQPTYGQQAPQPFSVPDRPVMGGGPEFSSPKAQRKTKGHVASACVPCKRAHLRCDAQRPCSRCLSNGKEDTCVDVQHKKRGRPRLRDEREQRFEGMSQNYPPAVPPMRRPLSLYTPQPARIDTPPGDLHRTSSMGGTRVLKSQPGGGGYGAIAPRQYTERPLASDAGMFGTMPSTPRMVQTQGPICAFLTMEMQISKVTPGFGEMIGVQTVLSQKLHDLVSENDREKIFRLQRQFEEERRERDPTYLPPIYLKYEEDSVIQGVSFQADEVRTDREDTITFQAPDGHQRTHRVQLGLVKKGSTYFIVMVVIPMTSQTYQQPSASPYSREMFSRDSSGREPQYGYQPQPQPQPVFLNQSSSSFIQSSPFDPRGEVSYRAQGPLGSNIPQGANIHPFAQSQTRPAYVQAQNPYETPRSELPQGPSPAPPQQHRQQDLQLPPIRDQRGEGPSTEPIRQRDDRPRFGIGGLIERPDPAGRGGR